VRARAPQKDVARLAGVSQARVSILLSSGAAAFPAETWERITRAAREPGYSPNGAAQALRTGHIACIVTDIVNPFYPTLMVTGRISDELLAVNADGLPEHERHVLDWFCQDRVDGVVGVFFSLTANDFELLVDAYGPILRLFDSYTAGLCRHHLPDRQEAQTHRHGGRRRGLSRRACRGRHQARRRRCRSA
jgi:LacI family transcriptional regulator